MRESAAGQGAVVRLTGEVTEAIRMSVCTCPATREKRVIEGDLSRVESNSSRPLATLLSSTCSPDYCKGEPRTGTQRIPIRSPDRERSS